MAIPGVPTPDILARAQYSDATYAPITSAADADVTLTTGCYYMFWADVPWYFRNAANVTSSNGILLAAYEKLYVWASDAKLAASGIAVSQSGNMGYSLIVAA